MENKNVLKQILSLSVPLYLSGLFTTGYNLIDTAMVSKLLGSSALAGIGNAGTLMFLMQGAVLGLCSGLCSLVSKSIGKNDMHSARKCTACSLMLTLFVSVLMSVLVLAFMPQILSLLNAKQEFLDYTVSYLRISVIGFPVLAVYRLLEAWLNALSKNSVAMWLCVLALGLHPVLNLMFIKPLGIAGVALTSVISFAVCGILALVYIIKKHRAILFRGRDFKGCFFMITSQLRQSVPMSVMQLSKGIGLVLIQSACNAQGERFSAAFAVCSKLMHLSTDGATALSNCSVSLFSKDKDTRAVKTAVTVGIVFSLFSGGALIFLSKPLSALFLTDSSGLIGQFFLIIAPFFACLYVAVILRSVLLSRAHPYLAMTEGIFELITRIIMTFIAIKINRFWVIPLSFGASWTIGMIFMIIVTKLKKKL